MANHKRKKRKIKTINGYLPGDGPRGNSKVDQKKSEEIDDIKYKEFLEDVINLIKSKDHKVIDNDNNT